MEQPSVLKTALNYGAMSGLGSFLFFLGLSWVGLNPLNPVTSWFGVWIPIVFMVLGTRHFRDYENGGFLNYWPAFRIGFLTAAASGFLFALLLWVYGTVVDTTLVQRYVQESLELIEKSKDLSISMMGEELYNQSLDNLQKTTIDSLSVQECMNKMLGGLLVAFLTAAILRKQKPPISN